MAWYLVKHTESFKFTIYMLSDLCVVQSDAKVMQRSIV
jgi:hypothetical protein